MEKQSIGYRLAAFGLTVTMVSGNLSSLGSVVVNAAEADSSEVSALSLEGDSSETEEQTTDPQGNLDESGNGSGSDNSGDKKTTQLHLTIHLKLRQAMLLRHGKSVKLRIPL